MKILITNCHLTFPHGSEIFTATIARELIRRGHEVFLFTPEIGEFHLHMLRDVPTISNIGSWADEEFDAAILQHVNIIDKESLWNAVIKNILPESERIIVLSHGIAASPEVPPPPFGIFENAKYVCISEEIANYYTGLGLEWNVIKQPIEPAWFNLFNNKTHADRASKVVWAAHRHPLSDEFTDYCVRKQIGVHAAGNKIQYPSTVRDTYSKVDLVVGTGRWIYEGIAAGIPCIVADRDNTIGYVSLENVQEFEKFNMTLRHPDADLSNWEELFDNYDSSGSYDLHQYALENYHVANVVDQMMEIIGVR